MRYLFRVMMIKMPMMMTITITKMTMTLVMMPRIMMASMTTWCSKMDHSDG